MDRTRILGAVANASASNNKASEGDAIDGLLDRPFCVNRAFEYAQDVISGEEVAGKYIILATERL